MAAACLPEIIAKPARPQTAAAAQLELQMQSAVQGTDPERIQVTDRQKHAISMGEAGRYISGFTPPPKNLFGGRRRQEWGRNGVPGGNENRGGCMRNFKGSRILIVEDEVLIGIMASEMLEDMGATVLGPALNVTDGIALAESEAIDAALIDINLGETRSDPVVAVLERRGIPIVYTTGYARSEPLPDESLVLEKPYSADGLARALARSRQACLKSQTRRKNPALRRGGPISSRKTQRSGHGLR